MPDTVFYDKDGQGYTPEDIVGMGAAPAAAAPLWARVAADGTLTAGATGVTAARTPAGGVAGDYTVTFPAYAAAPAAVASTAFTSAVLATVASTDTTTATARVRVAQPGDVQVDRAFSILIHGA